MKIISVLEKRSEKVRQQETQITREIAQVMDGQMPSENCIPREPFFSEAIEKDQKFAERRKTKIQKLESRKQELAESVREERRILKELSEHKVLKRETIPGFRDSWIKECYDHGIDPLPTIRKAYPEAEIENKRDYTGPEVIFRHNGETKTIYLSTQL